MKLFSHYLKDRLFFIMIYMVSVLVCLCVFKLYNLELEAFTYAFMILCVLLVVCFCMDYYKYYKKHQTLLTLRSNSNVSLSCDLQDSSLIGEDYHKILVAMKEYHDQYVESSESKMHDLEDYFTMWVHQAKLPIAAMKLLLEDEKLSRSEIKLQLLRMDQYTDMVLAYLRLNSTHTDFLFKELESKMHDLEDYFTMWVHQAKLPIAAMKLLLEDENLSRSEIKLQLLRMDQYTDMVLAYLRLNSTHTDFLFKELELDNLIRQSIRRFSTEFIRKHIQLSFKETGDVILSDEKWLVFVLEQILSNSLKYTNENGLISIYMKSKHILVIEDNGIGISASDLNRVFEKGYTGMNGRSDKTASGLGLYLCKNILDMLNHKIRIESSVGKGTRVLLDLTHFEGRIE